MPSMDHFTSQEMRDIPSQWTDIIRICTYVISS